MRKKKRFGGWEIIEDSRGRGMEGRKSQREKKGKQAASCVSQFSQLRHLLNNPTVHIEDLWVENNISKFQLNPTVDEVAMAVFQKGVCLAPGQCLEAPEVRGLAPGQRLRRQNTQKQLKNTFFSVLIHSFLSTSTPTPNTRTLAQRR